VIFVLGCNANKQKVIVGIW